MTARVVVLGAGFGGLEVTASLSERFGADIDITLIDRAEHFVFGFAKLDVLFGKRTVDAVTHPYARIAKPGVRFVRTEIIAIDPAARRVTTDAGVFEADHLVIALGADLDPAATPGLNDHGHEFYSNAGAFAAHDVLAAFTGGRIVIGVAAAPFKCPPAPSETALLMHEYLTAQGLREASTIDLVMPMPAPVPPVPAASDALLHEFSARGIRWHPGRVITRLDPHEVVFEDATTLPFDLFLGVPRHVVPSVLVDAGLVDAGRVDGWVPVDPVTLQTAHPDVYAIGDAAAAGTPKAGAFAEGQAAVVADRIAARIADRTGAADSTREYDGAGVCYVEFGGHRAARVGVSFAGGTFDGASDGLATAKDDYRAARIRRWIGEPVPSA